MKPFVTAVLAAIVCALVPFASVQAEGRPVNLSNDEWPPFIMADGVSGKASQLVCEALRRTSHACTVAVEPWENVLEKARNGEVEGIAAAWKDEEREAFLLFSEPYLNNRIVPVTSAASTITVASVADLAGKRVALVSAYSYGDEIEAMAAEFEAIATDTSNAAMEEVRQGRADVALVDDLVARDRLGAGADLKVLPVVLAFRSLHLAMSRANPNAKKILADFQKGYESMLLDGTVNEILDVDWIATDIGNTGTIKVVMRNDVSFDSLANPAKQGSLYAVEQPTYQWMEERELGDSNVEYQVKGETYSSLQMALNSAFGEEIVCEHQEYTSTFDCSKLLEHDD